MNFIKCKIIILILPIFAISCYQKVKTNNNIYFHTIIIDTIIRKNWIIDSSGCNSLRKSISIDTNLFKNFIRRDIMEFEHNFGRPNIKKDNMYSYFISCAFKPNYKQINLKLENSHLKEYSNEIMQLVVVFDTEHKITNINIVNP
jgi:hypothetical protein